MGKKSPAPPPAPDYAAAATAQGAANLDAARLTARISNPNISTPLGGQRVTFGKSTFDQAGYDKAMADYQKQQDAYNQGGLQRGPRVGLSDSGGNDLGLGDFYGGGGIGGYSGGQFGAAPVAPTKEQFTTVTDQDTPYIEQYLTPEAQKTLEAQQRVDLALAGLGEQGIGLARDVLGKPFNPNLRDLQTTLGGYGQVAQGPDLAGMGQAGANVGAERVNRGPMEGQYGFARGGVSAPSLQGGIDTSGLGEIAYAPEGTTLQSKLDTSNLAAMPVNAGMTAQNAIMSRLSPQLERERTQLQTQLVNQGIPPNSEAYQTAMQQQAQRENDLLTQATVQGINLDMAARQQGFGEAQTLGTFGNTALQQMFQNRLAQQQAQNAAQGQAFSQRATQADFANQAAMQGFQAQLANQQAYNQAIAQNLQQGLSVQDAQNRAAQQMFGQRMDIQGLYNTALAQNQNAALQQQAAANAAQAQQFNQALQAGQFGNTALQQSLAQQLALRNQPLNEIAALMSGSQVQMPQFQGYTGANVGAAPVFGAAQAQDAAAMNRYGIAANQQAANTAGLFKLGGAAISAFSDRRLKSNIERVGTHPLGIGVYEYDIAGRRERGVMADEVESVKPEAVSTHESGYKMVNYGML